MKKEKKGEVEMREIKKKEISILKRDDKNYGKIQRKI